MKTPSHEYFTVFYVKVQLLDLPKYFFYIDVEIRSNKKHKWHQQKKRSLIYFMTIVVQNENQLFIYYIQIKFPFNITMSAITTFSTFAFNIPIGTYE